MSNQLATVEQATQALGVTSSLSPNKAITVFEMESLISQLPQIPIEIYRSLSGYGNNYSEDRSITIIVNSCDAEIDVDFTYKFERDSDFNQAATIPVKGCYVFSASNKSPIEAEFEVSGVDVRRIDGRCFYQILDSEDNETVFYKSLSGNRINQFSWSYLGWFNNCSITVIVIND